MEIAPGVYDLTAPRSGYFKGGYVHAFLVAHGPDLILIDTLYDRDAQVILDQLRELGKTPRDIKHILMTHGHRAHLGGLARIQELSGAPTYAHEWEADIITGDRAMQTPTLVPQKGIQSWPIIFLGTLVGPFVKHVPGRVDHLIGEGAQIGPIRVIHTPGHTPGHLCFYLPERRALFTGDAFCTWPLICPGWPQAMLNKKQTWESLRRLAALDVQSIGVGHGPPVIRDGQLILQQLAAKGTV